MKQIFLAGNVPYFAVMILIGGAFFLGLHLKEEPARIAIAEKGAVILEAVLDRPSLSPEQLDEEVKKPIVNVLNHYAAQGFVVIDVSKDENGNMQVAALPRAAVDITPLLRSAIKKKLDKTVGQGDE